MHRAATTSLRELAALFLRLGATAFGGPATHIAMIQAEVTADLKAIHIGWARRR